MRGRIDGELGRENEMVEGNNRGTRDRLQKQPKGWMANNERMEKRARGAAAVWRYATNYFAILYPPSHRLYPPRAILYLFVVSSIIYRGTPNIPATGL